MPTHYTFSPLDRIQIADLKSGHDREYRWISNDANGHVLSPVAGSDVRAETFTHDDIHALVEGNRVKVDVDWYSEKKALARMKHGGLNLFDLPEAEQREMLRKAEIVENLLKQERDDAKFARTDKCLGDALKQTLIVIVDRNAARAADGKAERCDQEMPTMKKMPSARTARRWLAAYENSGRDVMALRDGHHRSGNTFSSIEPTVLKMIEKHAVGYCDRRRPTITGQHKALCEEIDEMNKTLASDARMKAPCLTTFRKAVKSIPAFDVHAGRFGIDAAKRKFAVVGAGPESVRAFQRLIMDGHRVQLSTNYMEDGKMKQQRLWLLLSLDVATRCVTGIRLAETENSAAAVDLLRMSVSDKARYAVAAGCTSTWPMAARPITVATDTGSAWISTNFRSAVADTRSSLEYAPVGMPQLRGHAERLFGTIDRALMPNFSGRTFGSIAEKGQDNPADMASVWSSELGNAFVRYVVDVYHHTPHAALMGMTPFEKWTELTTTYGVLSKPRSDELRNIFATRIERAIDHRGVRVAGVYYQSHRLQEHRRTVGDTTVGVKFDPADIGEISVWMGDSWVSVPALHRDLFDGVHLADWSEAVKDLRRRNLLTAELSRHHVAGAMRDLKAMGDAAIARADIGATSATAEDVERAERELFYGIDLETDERDAGPASADEGGRAAGDRFANAVTVEGGPAPVKRPEGPVVDATEPNAASGPSPVRKRNPNINLED